MSFSETTNSLPTPKPFDKQLQKQIFQDGFLIKKIEGKKHLTASFHEQLFRIFCLNRPQKTIKEIDMKGQQLQYLLKISDKELASIVKEDSSTSFFPNIIYREKKTVYYLGQVSDSEETNRQVEVVELYPAKRHKSFPITYFTNPLEKAPPIVKFFNARLKLIQEEKKTTRSRT